MPVGSQCQCPGVYVLSYDYTDAAGNAAQTVIRTVHVVDYNCSSYQFTWGCQYYA